MKTQIKYLLFLLMMHFLLFTGIGLWEHNPKEFIGSSLWAIVIIINMIVYGKGNIK